MSDHLPAIDAPGGAYRERAIEPARTALLSIDMQNGEYSPDMLREACKLDSRLAGKNELRVSASRSRRRNSVERTRWSGRKRMKRQLQRAWHRSCYMEISGSRFSAPSITYRVAKLPQRQFQVDHHQND
jgi:hypothetical protein